MTDRRTKRNDEDSISCRLATASKNGFAEEPGCFEGFLQTASLDLFLRLQIV